MTAEAHGNGDAGRQIESDFEPCAKSAETQGLLPSHPAQNGASESARGGGQEPRPRPPSELGDPMNIAEVADLLGCSMWTVRQKYLPQGLPHVRASAVGKIVFFREQVIDWILKRQQKKGGNRP